MTRPLFACLLLLLAAPAAAQAPNPYDGAWALSFENKKGGRMSGRLVVDGAGGTWQVDSPGGRQAARAQGLAACEGLRAPIDVKVATPRKLVIVIQRSQARAGCRDSKMAFEKVDARTLKAAFPDGRALHAERE